MSIVNDQSGNDSLLPKDAVPLRKPWYLSGTRRFLLFNALFATAFFGPLRDLVRISLSSDYDSYIPLIPFVSAYLMYLSRRTVFSEKESFSVAGLFAIVIGILFLFVGRNYEARLDQRDYLAFIMFSSVTIWIGGFILFYGERSFRAKAFPLLFLFFMVPIPGVVLERIILFLQTGSAEVTYGFLKAAGVPVARDGFVFHLPSLDIEVANQCSGIRSSLALVITSVLAGNFFLRTGWARALLVILIIPIAILKNGFRIFTLSTLGVYVNEKILASDLHTKGGFVFFIFALFLLWAVILLLRKTERRGALKDG